VASKKSTPSKNKKAGTATSPVYNLHTIFPTIIITRDWEGVDKLNDDLKLEIWKKRALNPEGIYRSNLAGTWHSDDQLFTSTGKPGLALRDRFGQAMVAWGEAHGLKKADGVDMKLQAWAMVYSDRGYAAVHNHPNCHVSGVYYVDDTSNSDEKIMATGAPVKPGDIEFVDTRRHGGHQVPGMMLNPAAIMSFKRGRMIIFPNELPHYVHPIVGPGERIAVACNGTFLPRKP
jgi:uncharacterized protein (TIGR02466 family)